MTSSSHPSMMWTIWRVIFAHEVIYFPIIDKSDNVLFSFIYEQVGKREEREIHLNIYYVLSTFKSHYLISFLFWHYEVTITSVLQMKNCLMIQKIKYFAYISSKWKSKGHDLNSGCCPPKPLLSPLHHTSSWFFFHMLRNRPVGPCLPQTLWVSDMVFILLTQKHSQILTTAGNLSTASQLEARIIISIIHWTSSSARHCAKCFTIEIYNFYFTGEKAEASY